MSTGDVPVRVVLDQDPLPPIDEVGEEDGSTTSRPISSLQRNHLAPAASKGHRYIEKQISLDMKNSEKTKLPI
jgi:hypothetical protein